MPGEPQPDAEPAQRTISRRHPVAALSFFVGAALGMSFLESIMEWWVVGVAAAGGTAAWWASSLTDSPSRALRWVGRVAWVALLGLYALWLYLALAFGALLGWTAPSWSFAVLAFVSLGVAASWTRPVAGVRVSPALPLGAWIALVLSGWVREETVIRCDDFLAVAPPVEVVVPTHPDLASCRPGETRPSGRFPRTFWQAHDGDRVVFTTGGDAIEGGLDGAVCEASLQGGARPRCIGPAAGKSQGFIEHPELDRLLVFQWGIPTATGGQGSAIYELPLRAPIEALATHRFEDPLGEGFYEPRTSTLYAFSDRMDGVHPMRLPSFEPAPLIPLRFAPGELHYDTERGLGVACGNHVGAAIRGEPFELRSFVSDESSLAERLAVTWGCDWDPTSGRVFTTVPNLGLLVELDYDTGRVRRRWFVGMGMRSVEYDRARRRIYFTDFLRGYVLAFDERSETVVDRWFVGRFSRFVRLTRDGRALLATGNLGIVRIPLDD